MAVGALFAIVISLSFIRRWMVSASIDGKMCEGLISRLAKADRQKHTYKEGLEQTIRDNDVLVEEKLRKWDIPDKL